MSAKLNVLSVRPETKSQKQMNSKARCTLTKGEGQKCSASRRMLKSGWWSQYRCKKKHHSTQTHTLYRKGLMQRHTCGLLKINGNLHTWPTSWTRSKKSKTHNGTRTHKWTTPALYHKKHARPQRSPRVWKGAHNSPSWLKEDKKRQKLWIDCFWSVVCVWQDVYYMFLWLC